MSSIFGGFGHVADINLGQGTFAGGGPSGGGFGGGFGPLGGTPASGNPNAGGFPGIFPAGGVSNSGWAGIQTLQRQCTKEDVAAGRCTYGGPPGLSGKRPGWR